MMRKGDSPFLNQVAGKSSSESKNASSSFTLVRTMAVSFVRQRWQNEGNAKDRYYHNDYNFTCHFQKWHYALVIVIQPPKHISENILESSPVVQSSSPVQ